MSKQMCVFMSEETIDPTNQPTNQQTNQPTKNCFTDIVSRSIYQFLWHAQNPVIWRCPQLAPSKHRLHKLLRYVYFCTVTEISQIQNQVKTNQSFNHCCELSLFRCDKSYLFRRIWRAVRAVLRYLIFHGNRLKTE